MKMRFLGYLVMAGLLVAVGLAFWPTQPAAGQDSTSCTFTASIDNVVLRSGPGREYSEIRRINSGQALTITGRDVGLDLYIWWQTANDEWVRSDLGDSDCPSLCGDGICEYGETADSCSSDCTGTNASITGLNCVAADCQSCYESIDCYPDCNNCTCDANEYGCPTCYCDYGAGGTATTTTGTGGGGVVTTYADISCTFTASRDLNLRSGPGTTYEILGETVPDQTISIVARDVGDDTYVWWKTANEEWVRSDLGTSDCPNLCGDGVCEIDEDANTCAADCGSTSSSVTTVSTSTTCVVDTCESCYESVECYPTCGNCTCTTNEFGCPECYCTY